MGSETRQYRKKIKCRFVVVMTVEFKITKISTASIESPVVIVASRFVYPVYGLRRDRLHPVKDSRCHKTMTACFCRRIMKQRTDTRHYRCENVSWCSECIARLVSDLLETHFNGLICWSEQLAFYLLMCSTAELSSSKSCAKWCRASRLVSRVPLNWRTALKCLSRANSVVLKHD